MNARISLTFTVFAFVAGSLAARPGADIVPPQKRAVSVELASRLLQTRPAAELVVAPELKNPFNPPDFDRPDHEELKALAAAEAAAEATQPTKPAARRDILPIIAPMITPSGTVMIGGQPILLFGQKKLKVGDRLPIIFEGVPYELTITSIERNQFTLRLNREEITRPIRSASKP